MSLERYLLGLLATAICLAPVVIGAVRLRRRALPGWTGSPARVAEAIAITGLLVLALQLAGVLGIFDLVGVGAACILVGLAAWLATARIGPDEPREAIRAPEPTQPGRAAQLIALAAVAALAAAWGAGVIFTYRHGMETIDTLWYHLPQAARFVQTGTVLDLHYVDRDPVTVFYPANSVLFHSLGLLLFDRDLVSPVINLGWAALALAAGWAIGRPFGRGPHCLVAVVLVLATPVLVDTQPGGGYNDVVCIALLLSAVAMLVNGGTRAGPSAFAAAAAGVALGTKFTMIAPVLALGVGAVAISTPGTRLRQAGIWTAALVGFGGLWYIRNAVLVGNPLPSLDLALGPLSLPSPDVTTPTSSVGQYLTDLQIWREFYLPGLRKSLGLAWWAIILLAAAGALLALLRGSDRVQRMLGAVAAVSAVAFVFSPQFLGLPQFPIFFVANVRYAAAPIVLGLVLLPMQAGVRGARLAAWWLGVAAAILVGTEIDPSIWPTGLDLARFEDPVVGADAVAGAAVGAAVLAAGLGWWLLAPRLRAWRPPLPASRALFAAAALAAVAVAGWLVGDAYEKRRYAASAPLPRIYDWARGQQDTRIGVVGLVEQYPFYGVDDSNYVQYIGASRPDKGFGTIASCPQWRRAVNRGRYRWLVLAPHGFPISGRKIAPETRWTESSPAVQRVLREEGEGPVAGNIADLVRVDGHLDPATCPSRRRASVRRPRSTEPPPATSRGVVRELPPDGAGTERR